MSTQILSKITNRFNPFQIYSNVRLAIPSLIFVFCILLSSGNTSLINGNIVDWSILSADDTLAVFLKDVHVGILYSKTSIDSLSSSIKISVRLSISGEASNVTGSFTGVDMDEIREFDFNGNQISAFQRMKSPGGTALWELERKKSGKWELSVTVGGMKNTRMVENVGGNLIPSYTIQKGIYEKNLSVGQEWKDTLFDLTAAKNMIFTTKCTAVPDENNPNYAFHSHDDLTGIDKRHEVDTSGRIVLQEVPPIFVAKKYVADDKKGIKEIQGQKKIVNLYELFNIPVDREQKNNETIALSLKPGTKIHSSVLRFYNFEDNKYILKNLNKKCHTKNLSESIDNFNDWLSSTVTIQSGHPEIQNLANRLKGDKQCRCEISKSFNNYLFKNIEKKHVGTFSNAYETLKTGYGDCGEHAVLMAALLRAVGIESNVVYGVVYRTGKKYYIGHAWVVAYIKDLVFFDPALGIMPATKGYIPLILDDDGTKIVYLPGILGKFDISYVPKQ